MKYSPLLTILFLCALALGTITFPGTQAAAQASSPLYNTNDNTKSRKQISPYSFSKKKDKDISLNAERLKNNKLALANGINAFTQRLEQQISQRNEQTRERMRQSVSTSLSSSASQSGYNRRPSTTTSPDNRPQIYRPQNPAQGETPARLWNPR